MLITSAYLEVSRFLVRLLRRTPLQSTIASLDHPAPARAGFPFYSSRNRGTTQIICSEPF